MIYRSAAYVGAEWVCACVCAFVWRVVDSLRGLSIRNRQQRAMMRENTFSVLCAWPGEMLYTTTTALFSSHSHIDWVCAMLGLSSHSSLDQHYFKHSLSTSKLALDPLWKSTNKTRGGQHLVHRMSMSWPNTRLTFRWELRRLSSARKTNSRLFASPWSTSHALNSTFIIWGM